MLRGSDERTEGRSVFHPITTRVTEDYVLLTPVDVRDKSDGIERILPWLQPAASRRF